MRLAERLAELVDRPDEVTLVIPVDVVAAVGARQGGANYTVERGSGRVGDRTMTVDDGRIDVIIDGNPSVAWFRDVQ